MKISKEVLLLLVAGFLLLIVFVGVFLIFQQSPEKTAPVVTPTPAVLDKNPVEYNIPASQKAWGLVKNKPPLSTQDAQAKEKLLTDNPPNKNDVIYQTNDVTVIYTLPFDMFQATITTTDIQKAKDETASWFKSYGLSQEAICNLPLIFDIDLFTAQALKGKNVVFDPLPPGCQ